MRTPLAVIVLTLATAPAWGQIYKSTDADGNVVFTDTPPPDTPTEQVELQRTNTAPPPPAVPRADTGDAEEEPDEPAAPRAVITSPTNETTIPMGGGNFSVTANVEPGLDKGQGLRLTMDGEPQGDPQPSGFWDLTNVFRGGHDLVVEVVDSNGGVISSSEPVRVYVLRPSVN